MDQITGMIDGYIWSMPLVFLALVSGLYFSVRMGFPQIRRVREMFHYLMKGSESAEGISSFQGFAMALGGRIGVGNISGVATAICFGGPGAVFWMWVIAVIGAGSAFAESALAQIYKAKIRGEYRGGPAYYIDKGLGSKPFAAITAVIATVAYLFTGPTIQSFNIAESMHNAFGIHIGVVAAVLTILFALVVFGGMKRIGKVAEYIVPIMAILYIVIAFAVLIANYRNIVPMLSMIFSSAFHLNALYGALFGQAIVWGVKRGIYSNEAGMGSGAQASAAAEVSHPAKQGFAQSFSVYVDTLFVCTATAIMILSTNMYNVMDVDGVTPITQNIPGVEAGVGFTQAAVNSFIGGFGSAFVAIAIFFFSFTTLLSFAFYADTNIQYLTSDIRNEEIKKKILNVCMIIVIAVSCIGCFRSSASAWNIADIGVGLMAWSNFIAILLLSPVVFRCYRDYVKQKQMRLDPVFVPGDCGITGAELWDEIVKEKYDGLLQAKREAERRAAET